MNNLSCPIRGCPHSINGSARKFTTPSTIIRHLHSDSHQHSLHLIDPSICHEVGIYICSHSSCPCSPNTTFSTKTALDRHNEEHHTSTSPPLHSPMSPPPPSSSQSTYTFTPTIQPPSNTNTHNLPTYHPLSICNSLLSPSGPEDSSHTIVSWADGLAFIRDTYTHDPPDFRTNWRRYLKGNNKIWGNIDNYKSS